MFYAPLRCRLPAAQLAASLFSRDHSAVPGLPRHTAGLTAGVQRALLSGTIVCYIAEANAKFLHLPRQLLDFRAGRISCRHFLVRLPFIRQRLAQSLIVFPCWRVQRDDAAVPLFHAAVVDQSASNQQGGVFQEGTTSA